MKTGTLTGAAILVAASAGTASAGFISTVRDAGPIHHWRLGDSGRSTTAVDSVGGAHGSYTGTPSHAPGVLGGHDSAASLPGYVAVPHDSSMELASGTIMFWFNETGRFDDAGLISKDSSGYDTGGHLTIGLDDDGELKVRLQSRRKSYKLEADEDLISRNTWNSVAFSFGAQGMKLYVNGVLEDTHRYTGGLQGNFEPLVIGADSSSSGNRTVGPIKKPFSGLMDEVMIFDRQLSGDEIGGIVRAATVPTPGTVALASLGMVSLGLRRRRDD